MEDLYSVKLPVFEGPLDLLLHLIRENKVDIYDIPISLITGQYLHYIEMMKELDLEIAGEFIVMAATLIHIKSRMLLPADEESPPEAMEDPRLELVQRLIEYQKYKEAAGDFRKREDEWLRVFHRDPLSEADEEEGGEQHQDHCHQDREHQVHAGQGLGGSGCVFHGDASFPVEAGVSYCFSASAR